MEISKRPKIPVWVWINLTLALGAVSLYVFIASRTQAVGFPLDDAWIHQTYARNLAELGEWSFVPGVISAGSTSPLWTFLLALLHVIRPGTPFMLTYFLGVLVLWGLACLAELIFRKCITWNKTQLPLAGILIVLEWHLVWAGASGMETLLMAAVVLLVFFYLQAGSLRGYIFAGLTIGIGVWVRPDALTLVGPLFFILLLRKWGWKENGKALGSSLGALAIPLAAYLGFNYWMSGHIWPNTFYAKQAEYAILQDIPLVTRYTQILALPMVGAGILLLPGFIYKAFQAVQIRNLFWISAILWWLGYSLVYALQLPVTYQHGRYLIPAMPVYFLIGLIGSLEGLKFERGAKGVLWAIKRVWAVSVVAVLVAFLIIGGQSYAKDVAIVNTEMVAAANWLNTNTNTTDLIAVHDIGAVGYFSHRNIVDLAGLVTPELIPFIRDETQLARYLNQQGAAYLMTFPSWYPELTSRLEPVYVSFGAFSAPAGGENMTIYRWKQK